MGLHNSYWPMTLTIPMILMVPAAFCKQAADY